MHISRNRAAVIAVAVGSALAATGVAVTAQAASAGCAVTYTVTTQWSGGFSASVNITNLGDPLTAWALAWSFSAGQQVTQGWNGTFTQSGAQVSVANASWNGNLGTGASAGIGFNGSWNNASNPVPSSFSLNGTTCTGAATSSPTASPSTRPTSPSPSPSVGPTPSTSPPPGQGTWVAAPVNPYSGGPGTFMWLLSDGSILSNGADLHDWVKLVPDRNGSYANGSWQHLGTSPYGVGAAEEHLLPDGRFMQSGGEYIYQWPAGSSSNDHNGVQLYDPVTSTWTLGQSGLYGNLWDTGSASLRDGRVLGGDQRNTGTQIFNPATNTWSAAAGKPVSGGEDGWVPLSDGSVVAMGTSGSYRYDPAANRWYTNAAPPASYASGNVDPSTTSLLYDGRILVMGHNSTALYTPGTTPSSPGSWAQGPATPQSTYVDDVYTSVEPTGKVIFDSVRCSWLTGECGSASGPLVEEFDPASNTISTIPLPPDPSGAPVNFINLPNGQVMAAAGSRNWIYTPVGSPNDAWRPTVTAVTTTGNGTYHLTGTQLSGLVSTGEDDYQAPENYPIVYLTDQAGHVTYARSFNFSSMAPSKRGEVQTTDFTLPSSLARGTYTLYVSACGVSSRTGFTFTF